MASRKPLSKSQKKKFSQKINILIYFSFATHFTKVGGVFYPKITFKK